MNKTVTVNISGFVFYIEEEAYTVLSTYLNRIKSIFQSEEGADEIISDVESRIAELFHEKLGNQKEVVTMSDVEEVITVMGKPEDYIEEGSAESSHSYANQTNTSGRSRSRKIYRDPDDKILGGVCSGLAYYFNTEALVIRVAFIILAVAGLSGAFIYIILWALIPKAQTTSEKLRMQGESINVESIKKKVDDFKASSSANANATGEKLSSFLDRSIEGLGSVLNGAGKILVKIIGVFFAFLAIGLLIGLVAALVSPDSAVNINENAFSLSEIREMIFHGGVNFYLSIIGITLLTLTPIIGLIYGALRLVSGTGYRAKGLGTSLLALFIIGLVMSSAGIIRTVMDYKTDGNSEQILTISSPEIKKLHVKVINDDVFHSNINIDDHYHGGWEFFDLTDSHLINGQEIVLKTESTDGSVFRVKIDKRSQGKKALEAINFAENIEYNSFVENDTLFLMPYFKTYREDGFRAQRVRVTVYVPEGKVVSLDKNMSRLDLRGVRKGEAYKYEDGYKTDYDPSNQNQLEIDTLKKYNL
ncbi:MAG: PspC domain-containing protein [Flavobacteriales bacterium]